MNINDIISAPIHYMLSAVATVAANKKFPFRFRGTAVQRFAVDKKTVIRLSASLKLRCLHATVCEPMVDVVLGEVLVILKNNNVARAHGEYCRITVFYSAVSIATNSLVSITATKMLLTPTRRVGVNIGQKSAIATNSSSD